MGDKTQLFVMGLATKCRVKDVLFGVGIAVVLLNAMGVFMGNALSKIFPIEYVSCGAGFFFLIFALLTIGKEDEEKVGKGKSVLGIATTFFLAELGDKTQLSTIAFSATNPGYAVGVFVGAVLGMMLADSLGIIIAKMLGKQIPEKYMKIAAYLIFTVFGFKTLYDNFYLFIPGKVIYLTFTIAAIYALSSLLMLKGKKNEC